MIELFDSGLSARTAASVLLGANNHNANTGEESASFLLRYAALTFLRTVLVAKKDMDPNKAYDASTSDVSQLFQRAESLGLSFESSTVEAICDIQAVNEGITEPRSSMKLLSDAVNDLLNIVTKELSDFNLPTIDHSENLHW